MPNLPLPAIAAADIGGTFTDIVLRLPDGRLVAQKVLSTPGDYSRGLVDGLVTSCAAAGIPTRVVREICHGTTIGTNAILERKGARTGLITTRGFRDVLEIRRIRFPELYNIQWEKPRPLVPRELRLEITERIASDGNIVTAPSISETAAVIARLADAGVESIAISLINSYVNPAHEEWLAQQVATLAPDCLVTISSRLLPEMGEYERTSTAVASAYLGPIMDAYLRTLRTRLDAAKFAAPLFVAQSNGGLFLHSFALRKPYLTVESGPAAGCVAARQLARQCGYNQLIGVDMGGTTTKASFVADGEFAWASEFEVGSGMSIASRLITGSGYTIRCPTVDLAEVGAGGGSIASVDALGVLRVGPQSAGASPGPACYNQGGQEATLTDANVVLGYVNPAALAGDTFKIEASRARAAIGRLAARMGKSVEETAYGVHVIANSNMMVAIRAVSTQRGRDVREADMLAFGGSGPVQAVGLAASLGIRRVIVPPLPGLFSSLGLLVADVEHHVMRGFVAPLGAVDLALLNQAFLTMETEVLDELRETGFKERMVVERQAAIKFIERSGEVILRVTPGPIDAEELSGLKQRFVEEFRRSYRHAPADATAEFLNLRVIGRIQRELEPAQVFRNAKPSVGPAAGSERPVYFGPQAGYLPVPVLSRADLGPDARGGPYVVEEADSSTVIHPGWSARLDDWGNIIVDRSG